VTAARNEIEAEVLELLEAERLSRIAGNLHAYCRHIEIPGAPLNDDEDCEEFYPEKVSPAAHHDLLNAALMQLADPDHRMRRLMVFMPPGSAKSTYGTVTFPTWFMGNNPNEPVICASYGSDLAKKFGRRCRQIVSGEAYRELFGAGLEPGNRAADDWSLTNGATYMSGGILSGMTGNRAKLLAIDDPVQGREQADSPTIRDKTWDAYQDDLATRLKPGGLQLIIQTRWHEDDLSGRILPDDWDGESGWITSQQGDEWFVICIEAECTREDDPLGRQIGEFLWTEYKPAEEWESEKRKGSRRWASLYQQRPRPQEGSLIQRNWIRRYEERPAEFSRIVQSWDTAYKDKEINDPSVCTTWGETRTRRYYLLEVFRDRLKYPDVKRAVISQAMRWEPQAVLIEDKASGQSLIQELREGITVGGKLIVPPVIAVDPKGVNKIDRLVAVSSIFEAGMVWLPEAAAWLTDYEMELFGFPLSTHDDQVDSTSQYLAWAHSTRVRVDYHAAGGRRAGLEEETSHRRESEEYDLGLGSGDNFGGFM
jgi:predicted phage terminase large subunit-like protein